MSLGYKAARGLVNDRKRIMWSDDLRFRLHQTDDRVRIWSELNENISPALPQLLKLQEAMLWSRNSEEDELRVWLETRELTQRCHNENAPGRIRIKGLSYLKEKSPQDTCGPFSPFNPGR
ncbi:hypothetical protein TNCV_4086411 [Trichonephila clavipes]|nr:hypothetical protein TNCV_4086411 [Trichonephila clavipes]